MTIILHLPSLQVFIPCNGIANRSKEKISKDIYKETRYLIERVFRLVAAVVLTSEMSLSEFSLLTIINNLQSLYSDLAHSEVDLQYLHVQEGETLPRDVFFPIPCSGRQKACSFCAVVHPVV